MSEEGVLMGYFLKENLNRLNVREIRYAYFENSGSGECYWIKFGNGNECEILD